MGPQDRVIRVVAFTSGRNQPSARFRIRQHVDPLRALGIDVAERCPAVDQHARFPGPLGRLRLRYVAPLAAAQALFNLGLRVPSLIDGRRADVSWIERNFVPGLERLVRLACAPRVLDVDDAIWLGNPFGTGAIASLARSADVVVAGNAYLADWFSRHARDVRIVPTAIDARRFAPAQANARRDERRPFVVGWTGTSANFRFLSIAAPAIRAFVGETPGARLRIVADRPPTASELAGVSADHVDFLRWSPDIEATALQDLDVGLMPLADNAWTKGKCSFKMLQYMATAVPVVVSPVGMNAEVLALGECGLAAHRTDDWLDALRLLRDDRARAARMGETGRRIVEGRFDVEVVARQLAAVFRDVAR